MVIFSVDLAGIYLLVLRTHLHNCAQWLINEAQYRMSVRKQHDDDKWEFGCLLFSEQLYKHFLVWKYTTLQEHTVNVEFLRAETVKSETHPDSRWLTRQYYFPLPSLQPLYKTGFYFKELSVKACGLFREGHHFNWVVNTEY